MPEPTNPAAIQARVLAFGGLWVKQPFNPDGTLAAELTQAATSQMLFALAGIALKHGLNPTLAALHRTYPKNHALTYGSLVQSLVSLAQPEPQPAQR